MLSNWAYKKLGDKTKAEDLTQEVLLQVFAAVKKNISENKQIEKPENMVWKIAHYVWCHYLRKDANYKMFVPLDETQIDNDMDFAEKYADNEEEKQLILHMRERISRLNFMQREIMICFYIDGKSIRQIAVQFGISESAVKWHLFDTRKKLKKEIATMSNTDYFYRPRTLHMGINGQAVPAPDTYLIENSLTKQNICIA